jgi:hypothetical protein
MTERKERVPLNTRVARDAREVIERIAEAERTTPAHIARRWLEDAAHEYDRSRRAA